MLKHDPILMPRLLFALLLTATGCAATASLPTTPADWTTDAQMHRAQIGQRFAYQCPPNPTQSAVGTVWGAEVYTDDSSVCTAAVHAGRISFARGGTVTIEMRPGQASYRGTDWNGVVSQPYGT